MTVHLATLTALIGPPPVDPPSVDWDVVATEVGFVPPREYREFASAYGLGRLGSFLWVAVPQSPVPNLTLKAKLQRGRELRAALAQAGDEDVPPFDPATMLMFGETDNGDGCYWLRESDDPDTWPVLVDSEDGEDWQRLEVSFHEFVHGAALGTMAPQILALEHDHGPEGFERPWRFVPYAPGG